MKGYDFTTPGSAIKRKIKFDSETSRLVIESVQPNIEECLKFAKTVRSANEENSTTLWRDRDYVKVAEVPVWLVEKWYREEGISPWDADPDVRARYLAKLNDAEYAFCRTAPGVI